MGKPPCRKTSCSGAEGEETGRPEYVATPLTAKLMVKTVQFRPSQYSFQAYSWTMSHYNSLIPVLRKAPQPPLAYPGAIPDSDRAKKPPLGERRAIERELNPGDRVEGLGNFGKPNGELGTVERTNEEDALVKWDDDGRTRLRQPSLKKV
jgi:hypothetical protein